MNKSSENRARRPILITGADGFLGKNLIAALRAAGYTNLLCFDLHTPPELLGKYAALASFVFHFAGVNRPTNPGEFYTGNSGFSQELLHHLARANNRAPVLITSSVQAELDNDYGKSKYEAEQLVFAHEQATGAPALVYRLPGVFGKWCRPAYNSVVATFCHNIAHNLPIEIRDPAFTLPLIYVDDLMKMMIQALQGNTPRERSRFGRCLLTCPIYRITLGELAQTLRSFREARTTKEVPNQADPFLRKLYATYLSYLPQDDFCYPLTTHSDERGSFTEFLRTPDRGQVSINVTKPGISKGNHWHHTKNEKFLVVQGQAVIRLRKIYDDKVLEYFVSGQQLQVVEIPVGYTHQIENIGTQDLITVMWANEPFNPQAPDTFAEPVSN